MRKPILFSDCDGVVYDTIDTAFEIMRQDGVDMKNHAAIDEYFRLWLEWDEVFRKAEVINDAVEKLKLLKKSGLYSDVIILTRLSGNIKEEKIKREIFNSTLPEIRVITLSFGQSKASVVDAKDNILVDDEMKNINPWRDASGIPILFRKSGIDLENDVINDLLDIQNTKSVKKLLKKR